jgi:hypothetical protein
MNSLDYVLTVAIDQWEERMGRSMTMDDVFSWGWRYPPSRRKKGHTYRDEYALEDNGIFKLIDGAEYPVSTTTDTVMRSLFYSTSNEIPKSQTMYHQDTIGTFAKHLEQKVKHRNVMLSDFIRDERGRFAKEGFSFDELALHRTPSYPYNSIEANWFAQNPLWNSLSRRRKAFLHVVKTLRPCIKLDDGFPKSMDKATEAQIASLSLNELEHNQIYNIVCRRGEGKLRCVSTMMYELWPNYIQDELIWNHTHTLTELQIHTHLNNMVVDMSMGQARVTMQYKRKLYWSIGNGKKRKEFMTYMDTKRTIFFDIYIPRFKVTNTLSQYYGQWVDECIVEIQGPHHYRVIRWARGGKRGQQGIKIDESDPQWEECFTRYLRVVKNDRSKKRRLGNKLIYIPTSRYAVPVKGVHGNLGAYNNRHLTEQSRRKGRHGLAELFEMQKKTTIGGLIREHIEAIV